MERRDATAKTVVRVVSEKVSPVGSGRFAWRRTFRAAVARAVRDAVLLAKAPSIFKINGPTSEAASKTCFAAVGVKRRGKVGGSRALLAVKF